MSQLIMHDKIIVARDYSDIFDEMYFTKLGILKKQNKQKKTKNKAKKRRKMAKQSRRRNRKK